MTETTLAERSQPSAQPALPLSSDRHTRRRRGMGLMVLTTGAAALLMGFRAPTVATALGADTLDPAPVPRTSRRRWPVRRRLPMASAVPSAAGCVVPLPGGLARPGRLASRIRGRHGRVTHVRARPAPSPSAAAVTPQVLTGQGVETGFGVVQVSITVEGTHHHRRPGRGAAV